MQTRNRFPSPRTALAALLLAVGLIAHPVSAADDDAPKQEVVGWLVVKSFDSIDALAKEMDVILPPDISAAGLEKELPFIGPGGLDTSKPIGIVLFSGGKKADESFAVAIPCKPNGGSLEALKQQGLEPLPGHDDTILAGDTLLRRTANYLIFGQPQQGILNLKEEAITKALPEAELLAKAWVDFKKFRTLMPEEWTKVVEDITADASRDPVGKQLFGDPMAKFLKEDLNTLTLSVEKTAAGLHAAARVDAVTLPAPTAGLQQGGMPAGVFARVDLAVPLAKLFPVLTEESVRTFVDKAAAEDANIPPDMRAQMADIAGRAAKVVAGADGTSVGMELGIDQPVFYVVQQRQAGAGDVGEQIKTIVMEVDGIFKKMNEPAPMDYRAYNAPIGTVHRIRFVENGRALAYLDVLERGGTLMAAISNTEHRWIDRLAATRPNGGMGKLLALNVDLGKMVNTMTKVPECPVTGQMNDEQKTKLRQAMTGQMATLSVSGQGQTLAVDLEVPKALLKFLGQWYMLEMAPPPPPDGAEPKPAPALPPEPPALKPAPVPE